MFVGLTGGIGSGKSTVAQMFATLGARVVLADVISKELLEIGHPGFAPVVAHFGSEILKTDGQIDRQALAQRVFNNPIALQELEAILHPLVAQEVAKMRSGLSPDDIIIYESPLLIEKQIHLTCEAVIVVTAETNLRLSRLLERGLSPDEAQKRMTHQLDDETRIAVADYVIDNSGSLEDLSEQVRRVWLALNAKRSPA